MKSEFIEITSAGEVIHYSKAITKTTSISSFMEGVTSGRPISTPVLVPGTIKFETIGDVKLMYVVEPPSINYASYAPRDNSRIIYDEAPVIYPYRIHVFVITSNNLLDSEQYRYFFCGRNPFDYAENWSELPLRLPWVPNQYDNGRVCGGAGFSVIGGNRTLTLQQKITDSMEYMRTCMYNNDLSQFCDWVPKAFRADLPEEHEGLVSTGPWVESNDPVLSAFVSVVETGRYFMNTFGHDEAIQKILDICFESTEGAFSVNTLLKCFRGEI